MFHLFYPVVTVELTAADYSVDEGEGMVEVCLSLDTPIATPLTVYIEAIPETPVSAEGKFVRQKHAAYFCV